MHSRTVLLILGTIRIAVGDSNFEVEHLGKIVKLNSGSTLKCLLEFNSKWFFEFNLKEINCSNTIALTALTLKKISSSTRKLEFDVFLEFGIRRVSQTRIFVFANPNQMARLN